MKEGTASSKDHRREDEGSGRILGDTILSLRRALEDGQGGQANEGIELGV